MVCVRVREISVSFSNEIRRFLSSLHDVSFVLTMTHMCGLCHVLSDHFGFICFCLRETVNLIRFGSVILIYFVKLVSFLNIMQ